MTPVRHADGTHLSEQSMIMDITERKRAEAALEESRTQIAAVMNSTKDFIWSVDPERFGLLTWNRAFRDYFFEQRGIELEVGMTPAELVPPDYVPLWHDLFSRALRKEFVVTEYVVVAQTITLLLSLYAMTPGRQGVRHIGVRKGHYRAQAGGDRSYGKAKSDSGSWRRTSAIYLGG